MEKTKPTGAVTSKSLAEEENVSSEVHGEISTRRAADETSLEVDHMILNYLTWRALNSYKYGSPRNEILDLSQAATSVEEFLQLFKVRHPDFKFDSETRLRVLVLKLAALIVQRLVRSRCTPKMKTLNLIRVNNQMRAVKWIESTDRKPTYGYDIAPFENHLPLPRSYLEQSRANTLSTLETAAEDEAYNDSFYGTSNCVSLLDILPLFLQVCAACCAMYGSNMTSQLIVLTKELMISACLEQYLVFGAHGAAIIDEAFAWGYAPNDDGKSEDRDQLGIGGSSVNHLFEDEESHSEISGWTEARESMITLLFDHDAQEKHQNDQPREFLKHLEYLNRKYPSMEMDHQLRNFIHKLSLGIEEPVLAQLEKGRLEGMSEAETQRFLLECGSDVAKIFRQV